jgi:hypothetical protein
VKPIAQLLTVFYNTRQNASNGHRNRFVKVDIEDMDQIKTAIIEQFNGPLAKVRGHVLVKFDGKMYLCERDTVNPKNIYTRHEISYHPLMDQFAQ